MEWYLAALLIFGSFVVLLIIGMPVAFSFLFVNVIGVFLFFGGEIGLRQLILSIFSSVALFTLLPIPLFILMGEVMFLSGIAPLMIDVMDKWLRRVPGRLSLLAVVGGTMFATLSGSSSAGVAMLGSVLVPEMEKRSYKKPMSLGPILGSGGLAMMIPPSAFAIILATLARVSVAKLLIAIVIPGLIMAGLYASYIIIRCYLQPFLAAPYEVVPTPLSEKLIATVRYILPLGLVVFAVTGVIFLGIAAPSESAALGVMSCFILAAFYRAFNWELLRKSASATLRVSGMVFLIFSGATAFSQILAYTGVTRSLVEFAAGLPLPPMVVLAAMQIMLLGMGMFMEPMSIMMVTLPIFMPIIHVLGFDAIWVGVILMINMEAAFTSPPFGLGLYVMKGVAPPDTTMGDIYRAALPFIGCDLVAMALIMAFPALALWLPALMR